MIPSSPLVFGGIAVGVLIYSAGTVDGDQLAIDDASLVAPSSTCDQRRLLA